MTKLKFAIPTIGTAMFLAITPVEATTYFITYTGIISSGPGIIAEDFGPDGLFTAPDGTRAQLLGADFTAVFTITAPLPGADTFGSGTNGQILGGTDRGPGVPSPASAALTINGVTQFFSGEKLGYFGIQNLSANDKLETTANSDEGGRISTMAIYIQSGVNDFLTTQDYTMPDTMPMTYIVQPGEDIAGGSFIITGGSGSDFYRASGFLNTTKLSISLTPPSANAVPEPASWAMMILGFGVIGGTVRRRQRTSVAYV